MANGIRQWPLDKIGAKFCAVFTRATQTEVDKMKYRKKPVVVEAVPTRDIQKAAEHNWTALPSWIRDEYERGHIIFTPEAVYIKTLEGNMKAEPSDMIIRGVNGEIYPCKPDIFDKTYESVEDDGIQYGVAEAR
jgi:hypothetical protein